MQVHLISCILEHVVGCVNRGVVNLVTKQLLSDTGAADTLLRSRSLGLQSEISTARLHDEKVELLSSFPVKDILTSRGFAENVQIRNDINNQTLGFTYSFKKALGSPLFSVAIVDVVYPVVALGPTIADSDLKVMKKDKENSSDSETPEEQPSFLRKYWWIIVGMMLLSSVFGNSEQPRAEGSAASSSQ